MEINPVHAVMFHQANCVVALFSSMEHGERNIPRWSSGHLRRSLASHPLGGFQRSSHPLRRSHWRVLGSTVVEQLHLIISGTEQVEHICTLTLLNFAKHVNTRSEWRIGRPSEGRINQHQLTMGCFANVFLQIKPSTGTGIILTLF